jgi:hypothetical protein
MIDCREFSLKVLEDAREHDISSDARQAILLAGIVVLLGKIGDKLSANVLAQIKSVTPIKGMPPRGTLDPTWACPDCCKRPCGCPYLGGIA